MTEINDELVTIQTPRDQVPSHASIALMDSALRTGSIPESEKPELRSSDLLNNSQTDHLEARQMIRKLSQEFQEVTVMKFDIDSARVSQQLFDDDIADEPQRIPNQFHSAE